jgi:hypothetical protein
MNFPLAMGKIQHTLKLFAAFEAKVKNDVSLLGLAQRGVLIFHNDYLMGFLVSCTPLDHVNLPGENGLDCPILA